MELQSERTREVVDEPGRKARDYWKSVIEGGKYAGSEIASADQIAYANVLDVGMKVGLGSLAMTFAIYVLGIASPHISLDEVPRYWAMSVHDYLHAARVPTGWGWISLTTKGDFLNFLPIAFLSAVTVFCYLRILPILLARADKIFSAIVIAEIVVLVLAASGILAGGH